MATLQDLQNALVAADKAGATDDARVLAGAIMKLKSQPTAPQAPQPKPDFEDPGALGTLPIAAGKTFDRVLDGFTQMYLGARGESSALGGLKQNVAEKDAIYKPLQEARPFSTGIGESLPSMVLPGTGGATLLQAAGRMGAAAAIPAALEYGSAGERANRAIIAGTAGAAIPVAGAALKSAKSFAEPLYAAGRNKIVGRTLNRVAGDDAANVVSRLKNATPLVPGSMPTAAEVAENGGIAALQRTASQAGPSAYTQRLMEQASARLNALRGVAGDDAALAAAEAARDTAAKPLYAQAKSEAMKNTPELSAILESLPPGVMQKAHSLAMLAREPLKAGKDIPAHTVATGILDASGNAIVRDVAEQSASYSGRALHYIKLALDDTLSKTGDGALGNTEKRLMTGAKDDLLGLVDTGIPSYGAARAKYAELSRPVNQMQIGQSLYDKLKPALSDFGQIGTETKATFANALRNGDKLAADATGFKGAKLDSVMDPQQMSTITSIAQDLARKANAENLGRGVGSDTFQKLAMQNIAEQSGMPRLVGGLLDLPGVQRATKWVYRDTDEQAQKVIADAMLNPQKAAELMQAAKSGLLDSSPKLKKLLFQSTVRTGGLLGSATVAQE